MKDMLNYVSSLLGGIVGRAVGVLINLSAQSRPLEQTGAAPFSGVGDEPGQVHPVCEHGTNGPCPHCAKAKALWTYFELDDLPAWAVREIEEGLWG